MKRLVLVDGNALLHRAYHATPPLSTSKGELVNKPDYEIRYQEIVPVHLKLVNKQS